MKFHYYYYNDYSGHEMKAYLDSLGVEKKDIDDIIKRGVFYSIEVEYDTQTKKARLISTNGLKSNVESDIKDVTEKSESLIMFQEPKWHCDCTDDHDDWIVEIFEEEAIITCNWCGKVVAKSPIFIGKDVIFEKTQKLVDYIEKQHEEYVMKRNINFTDHELCSYFEGKEDGLKEALKFLQRDE